MQASTTRSHVSLRPTLVSPARAVLAGAFGLSLAWSAAQAQALETVKSVDLARYAGVWHEVARLPNKTQERCVADVTTSFARRGMRSFDVETHCRRADGTEEVDLGIARIQDTTTNAKMEIRFLPLALAWWPFAWSDYWILDLAPDYSHALVGVPARDAMWILSRKPELDAGVYQRLIAKARALGFDVDKLVRSKQVGG